MRVLFRTVSGVIAVVLAATIAPLPPASAGSATLCTTYKRCSEQGLTAAGYAKHNHKMFWQMYAGHNCTNYVAYRMVDKGMPNQRPWSGPGNATHWGAELKGRTNKRPKVGAVAWWKAGTSRGGSSGHVAYVEKVLSASKIVVSQDSWGGTFSWARITKSDGSWPSGFIHLKDDPLRNRERPGTSGTKRVGETLVADRGSWEPRPQVRYRWLVGGERVKGDGRKLHLNRHMIGKRVRVEVVARRLGYPRTVATSKPTRKVRPGHLTLDQTPALRGKAQVTRTLHVTSGSWSPRPDRVRYQWYADGKRLSGEHAASLRLRPRLVKAKIEAHVTARRPGYEPRTRVVRTDGRVEPGRLKMDRAPRLHGQADPGQTLRVARGRTEQRSERVVHWLRDGKRVKGATGRRFQVSRADLGHRIAAEVRYRKDAYATLTRSTAATPRVKVAPTVTTNAEQVRRGVRLQVTARGGGKDLTTTVLVKRRDEVVASERMRDGTVSLLLRGLPKGRSKIHVIVKATSRTERFEKVRNVRR